MPLFVLFAPNFEPLIKLINYLRIQNSFYLSLTQCMRGVASNTPAFIYIDMDLMELMPIYQKPNTSKKHPENLIYPYLLRKLDHANEVQNY